LSSRLPVVPGVPAAHIEKMFGGESPRDVDLAFPCGMRYYVPPGEIPREFQSMDNVFTQWGMSVFSGTTPPKGEVHLREGFDLEDVKKRVRVSLGDWEPKHEHKRALVGYMLAVAFEFKPEVTPSAA